MSKKSKNAEVWSQAKKKFRLSDAHIQMARGAGNEPKEIGLFGQSQARTLEGPSSSFH
jgi:hypothetical protein